jgi:hypothetical protein
VKLKSIALAAALAGMLAIAPAGSAAASQADDGYWSPGNCPQGVLCFWAGTNHPPEGPTETPSLMTTSEWSGKVTAFLFYNRTSRNAEITWSYDYLGTTYTGKRCAWANSSGDLYVPIHITKVTWHPSTC